MKKVLVSSLLPALMFAHTLPELIDLAHQNKLVQASSMDVQSLQDEYKSTKSAYLPSLSVGGQYMQTNKESMSVPDNGYQGYAKLDYVLYDGGKKYDVYKSYDASIKSSQKSLEALKNELSLSVTRLYFNYLSNEAAKKAKQKQVQQLLAQQERLENFFENGMITQDEVQKIVAQVRATQLELNQIELELETILHNLKYLTAQNVTIQSGSKVLADEFSNEANRFDLQALEYNLQSLKYSAESEKSAYLPTLVLQNQYNVYDYDYSSDAYANPQDQNIISLNLEWEIFDFFETKNSYSAKFKNYLGQKYRYDYEKQKADTDLELAKRAYKIAKLQIASAQEALNAANLTYDVVKSKFENGLVDNVAFLDALSQKFDAQSTLQSALYELEKKKADILYHGGDNIKEYIQ